MPERPFSFSEELAKYCPTCGGKLPCPLHDERLKAELFAPPDAEYPWDKIEMAEVGNYGTAIHDFLLLRDGSFVVGGGVVGESVENCRIVQVSLSKPESQRTIELGNYGNEINSFFLLPDGSFVVEGGINGCLLRIDPSKPEGELTTEFWKYGGEDGESIGTLLVFPDGSFAAGIHEWMTSSEVEENKRRGGFIIRIDPSKPEGQQETKLGKYGDHRINTALLLSDGSFVVGGGIGRILRIDPSKPDGQRETEFGNYNSEINSLLLLPDDSFVVGGTSGRILQIDPSKPEGQRETELGNYGSDIFNFILLPDKSFMVGGQSGRILRIDPLKPEGQREMDIGNSGDAILASHLLADGSFVVGGWDGRIQHWSVPEAEVRRWKERKLNAPEIPPMPE